MLVCTALFLMTTLGAGLFISTISNTQATGPDDILLPIHADVFAQWLCLPNQQHASLGPVADLLQSAPLFYGNHPRHFSPRHRTFNPVASNAGADRIWRGHFQQQRPAVSEEARLINGT